VEHWHYMHPDPRVAACLAAITEWLSRHAPSWAIDDTLEIVFVLGACKEALAKATPEIMSSGQGSRFTSSKQRACSSTPDPRSA
jgi:hypothetical protein